jgi:hypothetical protein
MMAGLSSRLTFGGLREQDKRPPFTAEVAIAPGWPAKVAGIVMPDSQIAKEATELARASCPPFLLNHCIRTYLWGSLAGKALGKTFDPEILYLACVLHDLGLTSRFEGNAPFEIQGAEAARAFLEKNGMPKEAIEMVWSGIAMHSSPMGDYRQPEIALVGNGAAWDVLGPDPTEHLNDVTQEIHTLFPRLGFKLAFVRTCVEVIRKYPRAASQGFMRDIRDRYMPEFRAVNFCDRVASAPFAE